MAGKGNNLSIFVLEMVFQASFSQISGLAQNAGSPLTNLYVSLHTADPGPSGSQTTSEAAYTGYARQAVARSSSGFTISGETISPNANVVFPTATGGSETETYFAIGTAASGAGVLLYSGAISPTIPVSSGVTPELSTSTTVTES